jgi:prepilin-type N-terminal cleavage/methylation domain-containing protein
MRNKQTGFTLVEIAIVLVIIGLLLGGVLKGQELINSARIKNLANDINGLSAAVYAYQDRYRALPGDDAGAKTRWAALPTLPATAGNGGIDGPFNAASGDTVTTETILFWRELRLAGLVSGDPESGAQPLNAVGGVLGVQSGAGSPAANAAGAFTQGLGGLVACHTNVLGKVAEALDSQLDDGKPATGAVRAWKQSALVKIDGGATEVDITVAGAKAPESPAYVDDGTTLYTVCKTIL